MAIEIRPYMPRIYFRVISGIIFNFVFLILVPLTLYLIFSGLLTQFEPYAGLGLYVWIVLIIISSIWFSVLSIGRSKNTIYSMDDKFLSMERDFLGMRKIHIPLEQLTNLDYKIGWIFDKVFGVGRISVYTAGSSGSDLVMHDIRDVVSNYEQFRKKLRYEKGIKVEESEARLLKSVNPDARFATIMASLGISFFLFFFLIPFSGGFISLLFFLDSMYIIFLLLGIVLVIMGAAGIIYLVYRSYELRRYDFYEDRLEYFEGFLTINKSTVPLERITNIEASQGIIERLFGYSHINVETAGSSGSEIVIVYIKDAENMVNDLKEVLKKHGRN